MRNDLESKTENQNSGIGRLAKRIIGICALTYAITIASFAIQGLLPPPKRIYTYQNPTEQYQKNINKLDTSYYKLKLNMEGMIYSVIGLGGIAFLKPKICPKQKN